MRKLVVFLFLASILLFSYTYAQDVFEVGGLLSTSTFKLSNHDINESHILINRTYHINLTAWAFTTTTINYTIPFKYYNPSTIEITDNALNTISYIKIGNTIYFNATDTQSPYRIDYDAIVFDEQDYSCSTHSYTSYDKIICEEKFNNYLNEIIEGNYSTFYNFTNLQRWQERDNQTIAVSLNNQPFNIIFKQYEANYTEANITLLEYAIVGTNNFKLEYDIPKNVSSGGGGGGGAGGTIQEILQIIPNVSVSIRPKLITITPITAKSEDKTTIYVENLINKPIKLTAYPTTGSDYVKYIRVGTKLINSPDDYTILDVGETKEFEIGLIIPNKTKTINIMFEDDRGLALGTSKIVIYPVKTSSLISKFIYPLAFRQNEKFDVGKNAIVIPSKVDLNIPIGWILFLLLFINIYNLFIHFSPKIYKRHKNITIWVIIGITFLIWIIPIPMTVILILNGLLGMINIFFEIF